MDEKELKLAEYNCKLEDVHKTMEIYARAVVMYFVIVGVCFKFILESEAQLILRGIGSILIIFNIFSLLINHWCKKTLHKHLLYLNSLGDKIGFQKYPSLNTGFNICILINYIVVLTTVVLIVHKLTFV